MPVHVDAIIIGGGLAGIHLGLAMQQRGLDPLIIDQEDEYRSSSVAAGMINPITGRRFALTWMYDDLKKIFTREYRYWEERWNASFFQKTHIYRSISQNDLVNDLDARLQDQQFRRFCRETTAEENIRLKNLLKLDNPIYVFKGFQLNTNAFLHYGIRHFTQQSRYIAHSWDTTADLLNHRTFRYGDFESDKIIFCTGTEMLKNPLFDWIPMSPNKGEVLLLKIQNWNFQELIKHKLFFVPFISGHTWVGTYNTREYSNEKPSPEGFQYIHDLVKENLLSPYEIISHIAALRPTMPDHKPVLGTHPDHQGIAVFNGFGSKGSSLIPYFAQEMIDYLWESKPLMKDVDIQRFLK